MSENRLRASSIEPLMNSRTHALSHIDTQVNAIATHAVTLGLVLGLIADILSTFMRHQGLPGWRFLSIVPRGLALFCAVFYIFKKRLIPSKTLKILSAWLLVILTSFLLTALKIPQFGSKGLLETTMLLIKSFQWPIYFFFFWDLFSGNEASRRNVSKCLDWIFFFYSSFVAAGALLHIEAFKSYADGARPGYKGIICGQNEAAGLLLTALAWNIYLFRWTVPRVFNFALTLLACILLGTKAGLIGMALLLLSFLFLRNFSVKKMTYAVSCLFAAGLGLATTSLGLLPTPRAVEKLLSYTSAQLNVLDSLFSVAISARDLRLKYLLSLFAEHTPWVLLIGGGAGVGVEPSEMDWFDLSYIGGIPLLFLVFWPPLAKIALTERSTSRRALSFSLFLSICFISFFGGHIVYSAVTCITLMAVLTLLLLETKHEHSHP